MVLQPATVALQAATVQTGSATGKAEQASPCGRRGACSAAVPLPTLLSDRPRGTPTGPRRGHLGPGRACANPQPGSEAHDATLFRGRRCSPCGTAARAPRRRCVSARARVQARIRERAHGPRQRVRLVSRAGAEIGQRAPWLQSRRRVRWRPRRPSLQRRRWRQYEWRRRPACSQVNVS